MTIITGNILKFKLLYLFIASIIEVYRVILVYFSLIINVESERVVVRIAVFVLKKHWLLLLLNNVFHSVIVNHGKASL